MAQATVIETAPASTRELPKPIGFDAVFAELDSQLDAGMHLNAAVAVYRDGELVLDIEHPRVRVDGPRTLFRAFSAGKPLAAAVLWRLIDTGLVDIDAPVAEYWPEFAQSGKSRVTVRHVMTHTAGLALDETRSDIDWMDWGRVVDVLAAAEPSHEPGAIMQYHAFSFGWLVAEIAARVTGDSFEVCFDREVRQPLGLHDTRYVISREDDANLASVAELRTAKDFYDPLLPSKMDGLLLLEINFPAGSCITSARDLARFYGGIVSPAAHLEAPDEGGETEGDEVQWLSARTRRMVYEVHAETYDLGERRIVQFGMGVASADHQPNRMAAPVAVVPTTFGHSGLGTCIGWGDPEHGLAVAILTDTALPEPVNHSRLNRISAAVREAVGLPSGEKAVW